MPAKVALIYDRVNTPYGGAEKVLLAIHEVFPDAPLYTSVYDAKKAPWAAVFEVKTSFLQKIPFAARFHRSLSLFMPLAFESFDLSAYDLIISITSAEAKGVLTKPNQLHICYLLTPTRYLWSHTEEYQKNILTGWLRKIIFRYLRWWDEAAALRPDFYIPISQLIAERTQQYYHRPTEQHLYPTVGLTASPPEHRDIKKPESLPDEYYLIVSRLVPYKKIDLAIEVCKRLNRNLVIIGNGPDLQRLQQIAGGKSSIVFLNAIHEDQLAAYYYHAKAFLAPAEEDFGITVLEAQRLGIPVIVFNKSGGAETVEEGVSGIHFSEHTPQALMEAIHFLESRKWVSGKIQETVVQYSEQSFKDQFKTRIEILVREYL